MLRDREKVEKLFEAWDEGKVSGYQISQVTNISQPLLYVYRRDISKIGKMANEKVELLADMYDEFIKVDSGGKQEATSTK